MSRFALSLEPPYYAVIFSAQQTDDLGGYGPMADLMMDLASQQDGYLGVETTRDAEGFGITVSYWRDEVAISGWKAHARHQAAQKSGQDRWYEHYELRIARVDRAYSGPEGRG